MKNTADVTGSKPIADLLQSISGVRAVNPLVAFAASMQERENTHTLPKLLSYQKYCRRDRLASSLALIYMVLLALTNPHCARVVGVPVVKILIG
jgi:hypothetical protein